MNCFLICADIRSTRLTVRMMISSTARAGEALLAYSPVNKEHAPQRDLSHTLRSIRYSFRRNVRSPSA